MKRNIIPRGNKRRFAISDVHGCIETFKTLVHEKIALQKEDQLFLLGDYVNRGPGSVGVLEEIYTLISQGYQVYPIRGNHEDKFLEEFGKKLSPAHKELIESMPYYYETEDFIFVHAGLNFTLDDPLEDTKTMKWGLGFRIEPDYDFLDGKKIIHGHVITSLSEIFDAVMDQTTYIPIDNGCYRSLKYEETAYGTLVALDLNEMRMVVQENVDIKKY
ncbi:metallophosphoesterase [Flavilitoribacter nigricans]|uniref:Serine/threonine protein phosphatase n=1 Tax=Flavilitoribacter nigricans (strain ATCC 23147 / DSM 23189 / NBRC 102662 / NCIMB 1420 / SS-2) TaxID=1122177 RepID=A0A2D0NL56_FLAN2|nr:metallophosphoesterase [Flavilitoribacter nigricans]PHN08473.1 serine/threonine protein phosphatase [Flavilitoribacter nigricans DSM 23189 = NBRC 102662]